MTRFLPSDAANDLASYIGSCCHAFAERTAFVEGEFSITYAQWWERSAALAGMLVQICGIGKGDRVAVMLANVIAFPVSTAAILRVGAVQVNVNPFYTAHELRHQLADADVSVVIACFASLPALAEAAPPGLGTVIVCDGSAPDAEAVLPDRIRVIALADVAAADAPTPQGWPVPVREDLAFLQYTGGTTGLSKGAMLSHGNILANIRQIQTVAAHHFEAQDLVVLTAIPLHHIFALTVNMFSTLAFGAKNVLVSQPRDLDGLVRQWARHEINFATGVNTLFKSLSTHVGFQRLAFAPGLITMGGGAPVQDIVSERWRRLTGRNIREGYGLSETSPVLTCTPFEEDRFLSSIGKAVAETELAIFDDEGQALPDGEIGELCARGPQVMQGYWRHPEATTAAFTQEGFFKTGDLARRDANGNFYIVDRQKDMILVSGFNVYPNEIEAIVAQLHEVLECACVGTPDPDTGEAVALYVVRSSEELGEAEVREHCRRNLAAYKVPRHISFIPEMPKTSVGKILRRELRARHAA